MSHTKIAIVTAASQGIGAACARRLAQEGHAVVIMARSAGIHDLASELGGHAVVGSVTSPSDIEKLVRHTIDLHGRIDAVICNTGHPPKGELLEISDDDWHVTLEMLFLNVVRIARLVTPHMQRAGGGAFVNISSFGAGKPSLKYPTSSVIRAALTNYATLFSRQYAKDGIRMNNVLPGFVDNFDVAAETLARIPPARAATAVEIANVVAFLASDRSTYLAGQDVAVDGGLLDGW